jgi:hypothetical protein
MLLALNGSATISWDDLKSTVSTLSTLLVFSDPVTLLVREAL